MFQLIYVLGIFFDNVLSSSLELPSPSRCEIKLICAVVNRKAVRGELSQLWDLELIRGVRPYYEEGRNSTDTFASDVYNAVTTGNIDFSN